MCILGKWESKDRGEVIGNDIRKWVADFNISHAALRKLLCIMNDNCAELFTLPSDPRTLMKTPNETQIEKIGSNGAYWHQGVETCLRRCFQLLEKDLSISLNINVDGLPLYNSSNSCFWPILFNIHDYPEIRPMAAGIYFGEQKPENAELFMKQFVDELNEIIAAGGLFINGFRLSVGIRCIICDSPARAFIKGKIIYEFYF